MKKYSNKNSFFDRYNYIIWTTFSLVAIVILGLFYLQFRSRYHYHKSQLKNQFETRLLNLNHEIERATHNVNIIQNSAQNYFLRTSTEDLPASLLLTSLSQLSPQEFYALDNIPAPFTPENTANLSGQGILQQLNTEQKREIEMAFTLNPLFQSITDDLHNIAWVYYTSKNQFISVYPWVSSQEFLFNQEVYDQDFYIMGLPENNPNRQLFWTKAYIDQAGKGLMVTAAAPVYEGDEFRGTVALDFTLGVLSDFVRGLEIQSRKQTNIFVMDEDHRLLAHPTLINPKDQEVMAADQAFPDELRDRLEEINSLPGGIFHQVGSYWIIHQKLEKVPWELIFWISHKEMSLATVLGMSWLFLIFLPGLGIIIVVANQLTEKEFIRPAGLLVNYIEQESQEKSTIPSNIPYTWQPWFIRISHTFQENHSLLAKLEEANHTLEQKVSDRTEKLSATTRELEEKNLDLVQTLQQLKRTQAQLIQTEKMSGLGQMVAGVAHEINNPIGFIYSNLDYLEEYTEELFKLIHLYDDYFPTPPAEIAQQREDMEISIIEEDIPKILQSMKHGTRRIRDIVLALRNFSRKDEAEYKAVNLHEGIDNTLMMIQYKLANIKIIKQYGELPLVSCAASEINQVFMSLLNNAIDAIEERSQGRTATPSYSGSILIQTKLQHSQQVLLQIQDNGIGIAPDVLDRIFEPFFTTKKIGKGTGLGMTISYQIITEKHGGKITCESTWGEGTIFNILLPVQASFSTPIAVKNRNKDT
jgi:signal transduction histidine kinase